ncbi:MAG: Dimethylmenaquinone methyltransferase [Enterovirga sp.]|nr:Dimethylmenaquinone methyltransferase [Enterovirga sp.]
MSSRSQTEFSFCIHPRRRQVDRATVERFKHVPVANVSDSMKPDGRGGAQLRPFHRAGGLAGPALTVKVPEGDNLMVHAALDRGEPGDVLVVDAGGNTLTAIVGEIMLDYAAARGFAGVVIDGAVRDWAAIREKPFPVFARALTHRGPTKTGPGELNCPVTVDGMRVDPGDLILGDDDGLVCVPFGELEEVYRASSAKQEAEVAMLSAIRTGTLDRSWVDATLLRLGCDGVRP